MRITALWRDTRYQIRPENALMGVMYFYNPVSNGDIKVSNNAHWAYTGTGLNNGDVLPGLLGYEIDAYYSNGKAPAGTVILAHSPLNLSNSAIPASKNYYSDMSIYTQACSLAPCISPSATVFAAGTMQWSWGLDSMYQAVNRENSAAKQMTRNILARMVDSTATLPALAP